MATPMTVLTVHTCFFCNCFRFQRWTFGWSQSSRASSRWRNWWWTTMTHQTKRGAALRPRCKKSRVLMTSTPALPWRWSPDAAVIGQVHLWQLFFDQRNVRLTSSIIYTVALLVSGGPWFVIWIMWAVLLHSSLLSGMRYKRRGVDADGHVANYVETEQLIHVHSHTLSFVQTRGSVPVFWSQAGYRYNPRPRLEKGQ